MLGRFGGEMRPTAAEPVSSLQSAEPTLISRELIRTSISSSDFKLLARLDVSCSSTIRQFACKLPT
jgi:hypothetical protein